MVLGSGGFIPGFEEAAARREAGEYAPISARFPDNYAERALAGKDAVLDTR